MPPPTKSTARVLLEKIWGSDFLGSIPAEWKASFKFNRTKTPGVSNDTDPDELSDSVVNSQVTTGRTNELEKETVTLASELDDTVHHGQELYRKLNLPIPFKKHLAANGAEIGDAGKEINPYNAKVAEVKELDLTAFLEIIAGYHFSYPSRINIDLPNILESVTGLIPKSVGGGESSETGTASASGEHAISLDLHAGAQASVVLAPQVYSIIKEFWGNNIKCTVYHVFLLAPCTEADLLARLEALVGSSVSPWPKYNPKQVELVLTGRRMTMQVTADSKGSSFVGSAGAASSAGGGTGFSEEHGVNVETVRIGPTIHGEITVGEPTSDSQTIEASADAYAHTLSTEFSVDRTSDPVTASITPTTIPATTGATAWPDADSGPFLFHVDPDPFDWGFVQFRCIVVNPADFPNN